jgi:predicted DCC family thiol-disulfide oxidoreductase YuxK
MSTMTTDVNELANKAAGNWKRFECFAWHRQPFDADRRTIVYTHNRDSGLLDQSNAAAIRKALEPFMTGKNPSVIDEHHDHWAVGWVDGYSIRVYRQDGTITKAFAKWCELREQLDNYPILDEEDYSQRESDATFENIQQEAGWLCRKRGLALPENFADAVYGWLSENDDSELENRDDQGAYPSEESILAAFKALGWMQ